MVGELLYYSHPGESLTRSFGGEYLGMNSVYALYKRGNVTSLDYEIGGLKIPTDNFGQLDCGLVLEGSRGGGEGSALELVYAAGVIISSQFGLCDSR